MDFNHGHGDPHGDDHRDHPATTLQFKVQTIAEPAPRPRWWSWTRRRDAAPRGIQIVDQRTGAPVAVVFDSAENAATIAHLFVTSPSMLYGIGRARKQLRNIAKRDADPRGDDTTAVRQLLREIHDTIDRHITTNATQKGE
jgi:hypothetical protein